MFTAEVENFKKVLARVMVLVALPVVPAGLALALWLRGTGGLLGSAAGFSIAALNSLAAVMIMSAALARSPVFIPAMLTGGYIGRILLIAGRSPGGALPSP